MNKWLGDEYIGMGYKLKSGNSGIKKPLKARNSDSVRYGDVRIDKDKTENPDIMHFCHPTGINCNECLKACDEGYHVIRKQTAEEIFKELSPIINNGAWDVEDIDAYYELKKKYLEDGK